MSTRSMSGAAWGRWVRSGNRIVLLPERHPARDDAEERELPAPVPVTAAQSGVIDARIDVFAQYSLLRMAKSPDAAARTDAGEMLGAVKAGVLAGIYKEDEQVPALRARRLGGNWWEIVPQGQDASLLRDPVEAPVIVFRDSVRSDAARLDPALRATWQAFRETLEQEEPPPCSIPPSSDTILTRRAASGGNALGFAPAGAVALQPKVVFFQKLSDQNGKFFRNQAERWAKVIGAAANPGDLPCTTIGATPYESGADVVRHLDKALFCLNFSPLTEVHVIGHMYEEGLLGARPWGGLYFRDPVPFKGPNAVRRDRGGRTVNDFPAAQLSDQVVFVLHGCNTAKGDPNFARGLFERLATDLKSPRVFGHPFSVCAGQRTGWREYSLRSPDGSLRHKTIPEYGESC